MKILYVTNDSLNYGSSKAILYLIDEIKDKIDIEFLIPEKGPLEEELKKRNITYKISKYYSSVKDLNKKDNILKRSIKKIINNIKTKKLSNYYKNKNIDIIHSVNSAVYIGALISKRLSIKHVWHIRELGEEDHNFTFYNKKYIYGLINNSDKVICISDVVFNKYKKYIDNNKLIKIYDGIKIDEYDTNKEKCSTINLLYAGNISKTKGVDDSLYAINELINEGITNIHLYIAGEGILLNELKKYVNNNKLNKYVTFLGYVKDMKNLRRKINICLVCSRCEAFGLVTVEAVASKSLVIGTNTGATKEILKDNGLFYNYGDYKELKEKIKYALNNKKEIEILIQNAYKNLCENFTVEECSTKVLEVYRGLVK